MGNIFQITCDGALFNRCLDCFLGKAAYIKNLKQNLADLETELGKLIDAKEDVMRRVNTAERHPMMKRLNKVQGWLSRVEAAKSDGDKLITCGSQEIKKLCLGGYCSKNCKSSYEFGKQVARKLGDVKTLMAEEAFEAVAEEVPQPAVDERPTEPTVVGLQSQFEQVCNCLEEESARIVGLYGMGGVGKTTLLTHIHNKFIQSPTNFNYVIWVVASKDLRLENIQETIGEQIGLLNDTWKNKRIEQKAQDIFRILKQKKFLLLLDDLWQRVDLTKVGVPLPGPQNNASKVVFTTRSEEVCGLMGAHTRFKVACLSNIDAWELFRQNVGEETMNSHPDILQLAQTAARECGGLPLALITIGRAMACKKTPEEWSYAIEVLRTSSSQFPGLGNEVYPLLKFSYDSLPSDTIRSCHLYCSLYPEDYCISKEKLIDCWIGERLLTERDRTGEQKEGYHILGILLHACLLEEGGDGEVKMHDVIRDMALWIACDIEREKENFFVYAGVGLVEAPDVRGWEKARRLSLMQNQIRNLSEIPTCPHLLTLLLNENNLRKIQNYFFQFMPSLKVLNLSHCELTKLPVGISELVSLQHLDLSESDIEEFPGELKALVNLKCLDLEYTRNLITIPRQLISNLSRLRVLRMFGASHNAFDEASENSILFGGGELIVEELLGLKHLEVITLTLRSSYGLQSFLNSHKLRSCTQALLLQHFKDSTSLEVSALADLKQLNRLQIANSVILEELKMDYAEEVQQFAFRSLNMVEICNCIQLKDLTFLVFAPNLKSIKVGICHAMEEIASEGKFAEVPEVMANLNPFEKLQNLEVAGARNLKSIYWKSLPFPHLKAMSFLHCKKLKKLPLDSNSAKERKIVISGERNWREQLQWEDEATRNAFLRCFRDV
uniref:NBS-LRR type disease resistance protein n=1 Tax=Poncirus trifoliata TaxID=37690 RepID=Q8H6R6_PONTR|nr:NBS-LRR type disease resistance protein [Citrus trifoliata]